MVEKKETEKSNAPLNGPWSPPEGTITSHTFQAEGRQIAYKAHAQWLHLQKEEKSIASMFHVAYLQDDAPRETRPLTFVFNGGPGAASAYLHVGALGPKRVAFADNGDALPPPTRLVDNPESWLAFTDLVFVDPIGTGYSRVLGKEAAEKDGEKEKGVDADEFWEIKRDLESLCEFIQQFLTRHKRWSSPVFIAGESYGGYRVGALVRLLQENYGVGLNGAFLISPALELATLNSNDYNLLYWSDSFPSMAAAAHHHKKCAPELLTLDAGELRSQAELFAQGTYLQLLAMGDAMPAERQSHLFQKISDYLGISYEFVASVGGRVRIDHFCRLLLKEQRRVCGLYDASISGVDPFPDRASHEGPDATLFSTSRIFTSGINALLSEELELDTSMEYSLINLTANETWKHKHRNHFIEDAKGSMDDLRYGMVLNPFMKVMIVHGVFDLVTPYLSSTRLVNQMKLDPSLQGNLSLNNYLGGHMFYSWKDSREAFTQDAANFFESACPNT